MTTTQRRHGQEVFEGSNAQCHCKKCEAKRQAVKRLVDSFSSIPHRWFERLTATDYLPLPMWGWFWIVEDSADVHNIETLLRRLDPAGDEELYESEWQRIVDTGIYAIEFDGELVLGINGAGYSFYGHHWEPLYDALGYEWHLH